MKAKGKPAPQTTLDDQGYALVIAADLANVIKKVKSGKTLSAGERRLLKSGTGSADAVAYDSIAQAAKVMGVTRAVLQKLKRQGAPGFHGSRVYPTELRPHLEARARDLGAGDDVRETLENRRILAQCKRIEHANLVESGGVIAVAPVLAAITTIGEQLKSALRAIYEDELPPVISGLSPEAIRIETRKANDRLCAKFFAGTDKIAKAALATPV